MIVLLVLYPRLSLLEDILSGWNLRAVLFWARKTKWFKRKHIWGSICTIDFHCRILLWRCNLSFSLLLNFGIFFDWILDFCMQLSLTRSYFFEILFKLFFFGFWIHWIYLINCSIMIHCISIELDFVSRLKKNILSPFWQGCNETAIRLAFLQIFWNRHFLSRLSHEIISHFG